MQSALQDAGTSLQSAVNRVQAGESLLEDGSGAFTDKQLLPPSEFEDPDDLAAAFFAQQAKKQQQETQLPIQEWATVIYAHAGGSNDDSDVASQEYRSEKRSEAIETTSSRQLVVDNLLLDFQHAIQDGL
jgi:hypothetical protein